MVRTVIWRCLSFWVIDFFRVWYEKSLWPDLLPPSAIIQIKWNVMLIDGEANGGCLAENNGGRCVARKAGVPRWDLLEHITKHWSFSFSFKIWVERGCILLEFVLAHGANFLGVFLVMAVHVFWSHTTQLLFSSPKYLECGWEREVKKV